MSDTKRCVQCEQTKPTSEFAPHPESADGYVKRCYTCRTKRLTVAEFEQQEQYEQRIAEFKHAMAAVRRAILYPPDQIVYALVDPRSDAMHYIGRTHMPRERFQTHLRCDGENPRKDAWIRELLGQGLQPRMQVLEEVVGDRHVVEQEMRWIFTAIRTGAPLTNAEARSAKLVTAVRRSPCTDFLNEPRDSPHLQALAPWSSVLLAGDDWNGEHMSLAEAVSWCIHHCPIELPAELLKMARAQGYTGTVM